MWPQSPFCGIRYFTSNSLGKLVDFRMAALDYPKVVDLIRDSWCPIWYGHIS
jgi:hypothetical protein